MQTQDDESKQGRIRFGEELCRQVLSVLGNGYETELSQVRKNNGVLKEALYIRKENSECVPCFYMEELYRSYCMGENVIGLAEYLANIVLNECESVKLQAKQCLEKEWMIDKIFLRLVNLEQNKEWLRDAVYVEYLDFAAVFHVLTEDCEEGVKSFQLPKHIWDTLEKGTAEEFFFQAVDNTRRLFPETLWRMEQIVTECRLWEEELAKGSSFQQTELYSHRLYMLSNQRRINGAAVVLYPGLLKRIGELFSGNFFIIPSSIHEVLLLKDTLEEDTEYLNCMVCEVNEQKVLPEEILSNHVYYYSVKDETLHCKRV